MEKKIYYLNPVFEAKYWGDVYKRQLYDQPEPVRRAVEKLAAFYGENL